MTWLVIVSSRLMVQEEIASDIRKTLRETFKRHLTYLK